MKKGKTYLVTLLALQALLAVFSVCDVLSKTAAGFEFLSLGFILCYGGMIVLLGVYAIGWQQVIRRIPLTTAYANRAVTVIWGMLWGRLLFREIITPQKIVGAVLIAAGVVLYAMCGQEGSEE